MDYLIVIILISLSALFSGLTLGILSLNKSDLKRKASLGNKEAKKIYPIRKKGNLLLCTLLLGNVGVNSTLAVFLGDIASGLTAGIMATGLIVIFGEIIPQAVFSRYALKLGSKTVWLVKIFIFLLYPVCGPIAALLNKILGEEMNTIYSRHELVKIIEEHEDSEGSDLDADEERIIKGALSYSEKTAVQIMTPRSQTFALEVNQTLTRDLLNTIKAEGFTRIPVFEKTPNKMKGLLYMKDLVNIESDAKICDIFRHEKNLTVKGSIRLDSLLNKFIKTKSHLAFVQNEAGELAGVVSLEDVLEEILSQEILDESD